MTLQLIESTFLVPFTMKLILSALLSAISLITTTIAAPVKRNVDPALVPQFGVQAGVNPSGTGDCDGITNAAGKVVKIPCSCPPDRNTFIQVCNVHVVLRLFLLTFVVLVLGRQRRCWEGS